jgi:hypothetical protein
MPEMQKSESGIFCRSCGYDLRSLAENRCPECGREFDPVNRRTYDLKPRRRALARWLWRFGILAVLTVIACASLITWTWRGWERDQRAYAHLKRYGIVRKELASMPVVEHLLPNRWQYLRTRVWSVCIDSERMTDHDWRTVQQLEYLRDGRFGRVPSSDAALQSLESLKGLTLLSISGENITDKQFAQLVGSMPKLEILVLSGKNMNDAALATVAKSKSLKQLSLARCEVTDRGLMLLVQTPSLKRLTLWQPAEMTDEGINQFKAARPDVQVRHVMD